MLLMHGLNEHSGRYEHVGHAFSGAGIEVHAHDHRGHGRTWGRRSYVDAFSDFLDDVEDHLTSLRALEPQLPAILLGHSMGGLIVHAYCVDDRPLPDVLVSSGAALASVGVPGWQRRLAGILARVIPKLGVGGKIDPAILSRDPDVGTAYEQDPLVPIGVTASLGQALLDGMEFHRSKRERLSVPALVLHGGADTLVPSEATELMLGVPGVERRVFDDFRHEIFNEIGHADVLDVVISWTHSQVDRLP
jgi:acylglycerol lipase